MVDRTTIDEILCARSDEALCAQITSCLLSRTTLFDMKDLIIHEFARGTVDQIVREWSRNPERIKKAGAGAD